jgi:hypothetical protein
MADHLYLSGRIDATVIHPGRDEIGENNISAPARGRAKLHRVHSIDDAHAGAVLIVG